MNDPQRLPLDNRAITIMVLLTMVWGFQQVTVKWALPDISGVMQGGLRSILSTVLLLAWARWQKIELFGRDGTLLSGIGAGLLFAAEFAFIFTGLSLTAASRMVVFVNLAPCFVVMGLALFVPGEHIGPRQWAGVLLAFAGVFVAFSEGFFGADRVSVLGDAFGLVAAFLWGATTVWIRATRLSAVTGTKCLFYQLAVSALLLPGGSVAIGEPGIVRWSATAVASLVFQGVVVAFASFLVWFWLLTRYYASRMAAYTFLSPLFGVLFGVVFLGERLSATFIAAVALVLAGITLVTWRGREQPA